MISLNRAALEGIRVIDLSQFEAGPSCTLSLAQMGAEVIKIEQPIYGEQSRMGARIVKKPEPGGDSVHFSLLNANKKGITLNLKDPEGKRILTELIKKGDVFVQNFAPGTIERLGFGYDAVKEINPRIVYAEVSGFHELSPYGKYPCFDGVAQAAGVVTSLTGEENGPPMQTGPNLADNLSGVYLAFGVVTALFQRNTTGKGQKVSVNMQDVCIHTSRGAFVDQIELGKESGRYGNHKFPGRAPCNMYPCKKRDENSKNDYVFIFCSTVPSSKQWPTLCRIIGREELLNDPEFATATKRAQHIDIVDKAISDWTTRYDKEEVMKILSEEGVPTGAVFTTKDIMEADYLRASGSVGTMHHPTLGDFDTLGTPHHLSDSCVPLEPSPTLGQHNDYVFRELLGMSDEEFDKLKAVNVI